MIDLLDNPNQIFWWSHCLYIFYWILLILHAPNFWKWFIVPCILFIIEKLYRFGNSMSQKGKSWVTTGVILPSKVWKLPFLRGWVASDLILRLPPPANF